MKAKIKRLLEIQRYGVLATQGEQYPYQSQIAFCAVQDGRDLIFAIREDTTKYRNIKRRSHVSFFVDNASNRIQDCGEAESVMVFGEALEMSSADAQTYRVVFVAKHPVLTDFIADPQCVFMRLRIHTYMFVHNFQDVVTIGASEM